MSRRIDIELTSRRDDGTWTWRAPGAKEPRGTLDGELVPTGVPVGTVIRAEAEFGLDGIVVVSVQAPKIDPRSERIPERIEIVGTKHDVPAGVSVVLAPGGRRRDGYDDEGRKPRRAPNRDRDSGPRRDGPERSAEGGRPAGGRPARPAAGERSARGERPRRDRPADGRPSDGRPSDGRPERPAADGRPRSRPGERPGGRPSDRPGDSSGERRPPRRGPGERGEAGGRSRLQTVTTYRNAALADLRAEEIPVAEQLLRGGIPAVRQAIEEQNTRARSEGRPELTPEPLLEMAEALLPKITLASWKDRATAARNAGKDAPLREVRSVVAGASAATLDEEGRDLLTGLRESLTTRVTALRESWVARITTALESGRVADALRVASQPPEPSARISADQAVQLSAAAGAAMTAELSDEQWKDLLDAVVASPVRRTVKPTGFPAQASQELLTAARRAAGLVPELARLFGLPIPPPPGPRRPVAARRT